MSKFLLFILLVLLLPLSFAYLNADLRVGITTTISIDYTNITFNNQTMIGNFTANNTIWCNGTLCGSGGGTNPFNQSLNTSDDVNFNSVNVTHNITLGGTQKDFIRWGENETVQLTSIPAWILELSSRTDAYIMFGMYFQEDSQYGAILGESNSYDMFGSPIVDGYKYGFMSLGGPDYISGMDTINLLEINMMNESANIKVHRGNLSIYAKGGYINTTMNLTNGSLVVTWDDFYNWSHLTLGAGGVNTLDGNVTGTIFKMNVSNTNVNSSFINTTLFNFTNAYGFGNLILAGNLGSPQKYATNIYASKYNFNLFASMDGTTVAGGIYFDTDDLYYEGLSFDIRSIDEDGADDSSIRIAGGGAAGDRTRGASVAVYGNDVAANVRGALILTAGDTNESGTWDDKVVIQADSLVPFVSGTNIGSAVNNWGNVYATKGNFSELNFTNAYGTWAGQRINLAYIPHTSNQDTNSTASPTFAGMTVNGIIQDPTFVKFVAGGSNGIWFWNSAAYAIYMVSPPTGTVLGGVTGYTIETRMSDTDGRGFTWTNGNEVGMSLESFTGQWDLTVLNDITAGDTVYATNLNSTNKVNASQGLILTKGSNITAGKWNMSQINSTTSCWGGCVSDM